MAYRDFEEVRRPLLRILEIHWTAVRPMESLVTRHGCVPAQRLVKGVPLWIGFWEVEAILVRQVSWLRYTLGCENGLRSLREDVKKTQATAHVFCLDLRARCYEEAEIITSRTPIYQQMIYQQVIIYQQVTHHTRVKCAVVFSTRPY